MPRLVAGAAAMGVLFLVYLQMALAGRRRPLVLLAAAWGVYLLRYLLVLAMPARQVVALVPVLFAACAMAGSLLLFWGVRLLCGRERPAWPPWALAATFAAAFGLKAAGAPFAAATAPASLAVAALYWLAARCLLGDSDLPGPYRHMAAAALIAWAILQGSYPVTARLPGFAPWGFLLSSVFEVTTALGILLAHLMRRRAELEAAHRALLQLAAGVAHNFNNVLMAVGGNLEAALDRKAGARERRRLLRGALDSALAGRQLVRRLWEQVGAPQPEQEPPAPVALAPVVESALCAVRGGLRLPGAELVETRVELEADWLVLGRTGELMEVFFNLIKNAIEAMPGGGKLVIDGKRCGGMLEVRVSDSGPGMEPQTLARVFEPFFSTKGVSGQGLGLSSSRGVLRAAAGDLLAESTPGRGSTFTVVLPLAPALAGPARPEAPRRELEGLSVLLVEDEALVAMGLAAVLAGAGCDVRNAASVAEARRALARARPDLVLCDLGLPDGSGWQVARMLADGAGPAPLVLLSAWPERPEPLEAELRHLVSAILQKPVEKRVLLDTVARNAGRGG